MNRFSLRREVTLGVLVYALYLLVRKLVLDARGRERALRNAERVVALEEHLRLDLEPASLPDSRDGAAEAVKPAGPRTANAPIAMTRSLLLLRTDMNHMPFSTPAAVAGPGVLLVEKVVQSRVSAAPCVP